MNIRVGGYAADVYKRQTMGTARLFRLFIFSSCSINASSFADSPFSPSALIFFIVAGYAPVRHVFSAFRRNFYKQKQKGGAAAAAPPVWLELFSEHLFVVGPEFCDARIRQRMLCHLLDDTVRYRGDIRARQRAVRHMHRVAHTGRNRCV